jgi:hypothetical protein
VMDRGREWAVWTHYVNIKKREWRIVFKFMCELNIWIFGIEIREEGKHMITGLKDQKKIINITTIKQGFKVRRAVS